MKHLTMAFIRRNFLSMNQNICVYVVSGIMLTFDFIRSKLNVAKQIVLYLVRQTES